MARYERIAGISGVNLGQIGEPRLPVVDKLLTRGVKIHPLTVARLRMGETNGHKIEDRLACQGVLEEGIAFKKDTYFFLLTGWGLVRRSYRLDPRYRNRFNSQGFTEEISESLPERPQVVRRCLRTMRAELVWTSLASDSPGLRESFVAIADQFLHDFPHLKLDSRPPSILAIDRLWDHSTVADFYRQLYQTATLRNLGLWTPYEMSLLHRFYQGQVDQGHPLTVLDREVLRVRIQRESMRQLVERTRKETGIPVDDEVLFHHGNLLVYGQPTPRGI
ncbi:hypothetical protein HYU96_02830 [Candidatus Daviesbacteria bacterium]|nr:hypothetical protein [Candidatus Daviesbacteria bacterium]